VRVDMVMCALVLMWVWCVVDGVLFHVKGKGQRSAGVSSAETATLFGNSGRNVAALRKQVRRKHALAVWVCAALRSCSMRCALTRTTPPTSFASIRVQARTSRRCVFSDDVCLGQYAVRLGADGTHVFCCGCLVLEV
jgi:hypothetical protein